MSQRDDLFKAWISEHLGVLHRLSRVFARGADQHDLLQEMLVSIWRAAPCFRGECKVSTFIFRVAHNAALTWRRGESRRRVREQEYARLQIGEPANSEDEPLLDRLYRAIRQLEALDRSLVLLLLEGQSYADIAAVHGLTETNVGVRLTRARKKLAQLMEAENGL